MSQTAGPNQEHIDVWNQILVPKFTRYRHVFIAIAAPHSRAAFKKCGPQAGDRVLDVGCGFGEDAIAMARMVAPGGQVVAVDCCQPFLEIGRNDAKAAGVTNVRFECVDAQTHPFESVYDVCYSRFGLMFFQSPVFALRNLCGALRPGGRLLALTWRPLELNPWVAIPKGIARKHLPPPDDAAPTCGPGPFSMADPDTVGGILHAAGFVEVSLQPLTVEGTVAGSVDEMIEVQLALGPAGEIVREAGPLGQEKKPAIEQELRLAMAPYLRSDGVFMASTSWLITARRPL
jgi:SAM-dependent methyltransferase